MHMHVFKKPLLLVKTTQWSKLRHLLTFFFAFLVLIAVVLNIS